MRFYDLYLKEKEKYQHLSVSYKIYKINNEDVVGINYIGLYGCRDSQNKSAFTKVEVEYNKEGKIANAFFRVGSDNKITPLVMNYKIDPYVFESSVDNQKRVTNDSMWQFGNRMTYFASHLDEDQCKELCLVVESIVDATKDYKKDEPWYGFDDIREEVSNALNSLEEDNCSLDEY